MMENLITWNTHSDHIRKVYNELYQNEVLTDVTLVCNDQTKIKAHKVILVACSAVFRSMLCNDTGSESKIYVRGVDRQTMTNILEFMYRGEVKIEMNRFQGFLQIAQELSMEEIGLTKSSKENSEEMFETEEQDQIPEQSQEDTLEEYVNQEDFKETKKLHAYGQTV